MFSTLSFKSLKRRVRSPITLLKKLFSSSKDGSKDLKDGSKNDSKKHGQSLNVVPTLDLPITASPASISSASSFSPTTPVSFASTTHPFIDADLQYSLGNLGIMIDPGTPPTPPAKGPPVPRLPPKEVLPALPPTASAENRVPSKWRNQPRAAAVQKAPTNVEPVAQVSVQADKSSTIVTQVPAIVVPCFPPESLPPAPVVPAVEIPASEVPATELAATIVPEPTSILENSLPAEHATETQETVGSRDLEPLSISAPVEASISKPPSTLEDVCMPSAPASDPRPISLVHSVPTNEEPLVSSPVDDCVQETMPEHTAEMPPPIDVLRTVTEVPGPTPVLVESPVETVAPPAAQEARAADKEFGVFPTGRAPQSFTSRMPRRSSVASSKVPSLSRVPVATPPTLATTRSTRAASITQDKDTAVLSELQASVRSREQRRMEREKREAAEKEREMQELREKVAAEKRIDLAELARKNSTVDPESVRAEVRSWRKQRESIMVLKSNTVDTVRAPAVREAMANTDIMTEVASAVESRSQRPFCDPREKRATLLLDELFARPAARVGTA